MLVSKGGRKMTIREWANKNKIKVVGKLKRQTHIEKKYNWKTYTLEEKKYTYYIDEVGNEFYKEKNGICAIMQNGGIY